MASSKSAGRNTPASGKSALAAKSSKSAVKKTLPAKAGGKSGGTQKSLVKKAAAPTGTAAKKAIAKKVIVKNAVKKAVVKKAVKKAVVKNAVKKAVVKKAVKKAIVKNVVKKAVAKNAVKKAVVKKAIRNAAAKSVKKAAVKAIVKKAIVKKVAAAKKVAVKKAVVRKVVTNKVAANAVKKAIVKKAIARNAVKKAIVKKAIAARRQPQSAKAQFAPMDDRKQLENLLHGLMSEASFFQKLYRKATGKLIKNSSSSALKGLFQKHQDEAQWFLKQLEGAFSMLNLKAKPAKSAALQGILQESESFMAQFPKGAGLDAALIANSQKLRHYEAAAFSVLRRLARLLGHEKLADVFEILRQGSHTLDNELAELGDESLNNPMSKAGTGSTSTMPEDASTEDSQAGEDSSSHISGNEESENAGSVDAQGNGIDVNYDDVADGADREGPSETGEPMGY